MKYKYILSIDPGGESGTKGETGISVGRYSESSPYELDDYFAIPAGVPFFAKWNKEFGGKFDTVICEDFIPYLAQGDVSPLKLIGAVQVLYPKVILRAPQRRLIVTPEQLKSIGAYVPGGNHRDVTESVRHAVSWLIKDQKHGPTQKAILK